VEGLRALLDISVASRLRGAGAAVGTHLSAGLDSSAVTATAARLTQAEGGKVVAFTAVPRSGFAADPNHGPLVDEGPLAAATAAMYPNIEHVCVRTSASSPLACLGDDLAWFDRPSLNPFNMVWLDAISREASERGVRVVLGAFSGNMTLSYAGLERLPELLRRGQLGLFWREMRRLRAKGKASWRGLAMQVAPGPIRALAGRGNPARTTARRLSALRADRLERLVRGRPTSRQLDGFATRLDVFARVDPGNFNKGYLARWGVDVRDPLADRRLIEFCLALPMEQFLRDGETRVIGRRALADRLPRAVLDEPRKGIQAGDWYESVDAARTEIERYVDELAAAPAAAGTLDIPRLQALVRDWPSEGWGRLEELRAYRLALLRGITGGVFLTRAARP
jgi:asparagine synthase (glutamine-hydrolysing)